MGAMEAVKEGFKEGVKAFVDGIGKAYDLAQSSPVLNDMANHGRSEVAAALFGGTSPYVMYMRGQHGQSEKELAAEVFGQKEMTPQEPKESQEQQVKHGLSL